MTTLSDALDRLLLYNNGNYDVSINPFGFDNNGHRQNFVPALRDVATVGNFLVATDPEDTAHVEQYGAFPDGTDQSANIQAAIDAMATRTNGGTVVFNAATYRAGPTITVPRGVSLVGQRQAGQLYPESDNVEMTVIKRIGAGTGPVIKLLNRWNGQFSNIQIDGNSTAQAGLWAIGPQSSLFNSCSIVRVAAGSDLVHNAGVVITTEGALYADGITQYPSTGNNEFFHITIRDMATGVIGLKLVGTRAAGVANSFFTINRFFGLAVFGGLNSVGVDIDAAADTNQFYGPFIQCFGASGVGVFFNRLGDIVGGFGHNFLGGAVYAGDGLGTAIKSQRMFDYSFFNCVYIGGATAYTDIDGAGYVAFSHTTNNPQLSQIPSGDDAATNATMYPLFSPRAHTTGPVSTAIGYDLPKTASTKLTFNPFTGTLSSTSFNGAWAGAAALSRTNDTNVTLTLGGTPGTALLQATSITVGWTGTLALSRLAQGTDGQLIVGQTSTSPLYKTITGDWTLSAAGAATLNTVNSNVGTFGSATQSPQVTVNGKGLVTGVINVTITPAVGSITGLGTGVATALATNVGTAGAPVVNGGALGTPSGGVGTNLTGTASGLTAGNVTTNANLTGPITSVGNATSVAAQTGTGTTFVMQASPSVTGTLTGATANFSGALTAVGNSAVGTASPIGYKFQVHAATDENLVATGHATLANGVTFISINDANSAYKGMEFQASDYYFLNGNVKFAGVGTTTSAANAFLDNASSNNLLRSTSSLAYKCDVEPLDDKYADAILKLNPIWYRSKAPADNPKWGWYGLGAEDVAKVDPRLVHWTYPEDAYETVEIGVRDVPDMEEVEEVYSEIERDGARAVVRQATRTIRRQKTERLPVFGDDGEPLMEPTEDDPAALVQVFHDFPLTKSEPITERRLKKNARLIPDGVQYDRIAVLLLSIIKRMKPPK